MDWESPSFVEVRMDAEIGSYQEDGGDPNQPVIDFADQNDGAPADER